MGFKKIIGRLLSSAGRGLPATDSRVFGRFSKAVRGAGAKLLMKRCGKNVNVEKGAYYTRNCSLGDNSGIGIDSYIGGTVTIGSDVMMGPECVIFARNHE